MAFSNFFTSPAHNETASPRLAIAIPIGIPMIVAAMQ